MAPFRLLCIPTIAIPVFILASNVKLASATSNHTISNILLPKPNVTGGPAGEIQCYALPYGAIGIISHLLTYWTIAWMAVGRIPLWPWHPLAKYRFDAILACMSLITCLPIAAVTMQRCRLTWHFILICVWKLVTSVSLACVTLHRCIITRRNSQDTHGHEDRVPLRYHNPNGFPHDPYLPHNAPYGNAPHGQMYQQGQNPSFFQPGAQSRHSREDFTPLWWLVLYLAGTIVGMVGLCSLLYTTFRYDQTIRQLTYGFGVAIIIIPVLVAIYWYMQHLENPNGGGRVCMSAFWHSVGGGILAFTATFGFFSAIYSDLILGTIANNIIGVPSEDFSALYWSWFLAKRFPLLSL